MTTFWLIQCRSMYDVSVLSMVANEKSRRTHDYVLFARAKAIKKKNYDVIYSKFEYRLALLLFFSHLHRSSRGQKKKIIIHLQLPPCAVCWPAPLGIYLLLFPCMGMHPIRVTCKLTRSWAVSPQESLMPYERGVPKSVPLRHNVNA